MIRDAKKSTKDFSKSVTGVAYKVFRFKDGKLYPPMVSNIGGTDTPVGVWLDAEEGEFAGLSKTGRPQVVNSQSSSQPLAYRPGWHLGDQPRAKQFDRSLSWVEVEQPLTGDVKTTRDELTLMSLAKKENLGKYFYLKDSGKYVQIVNDNAPYFPYDFVWAECDYVADVNYQDEADEMGYMRTNPDGTFYRGNSFVHSLAGLKHLPENGFYRYRTNPRPDTVPWVITGAMKVNRLLDDFEVSDILGGNAPERQGGNLTLKEMGLAQI